VRQVSEKKESLVAKESFSSNFWLKYHKDTGKKYVYLSGHSMGLQPRATEAYMVDALERWKHERDVLTLFRDFWFPMEDKITK
jgi:kynureninase